MPNNNEAHRANGQIECPNCGAVHALDDARCPYCDALNPAGAEKAYMDELADIREDTDDLAEDVQHSFNARVQGNARRVAIAVVAVIVVIAAAFLIAGGADRHSERQEIQSYQAREAFRTQHFPELDRLYEAGDDAALSAYAWSLMDDPGFDALFSWEHVGYLQVYDDWEVVKLAEGEFREGKGDIDDYTWTVSVAIGLARLDGNGQRASAQLSDSEEARAARYRADALKFLEDTLQMSGDELAAFAASALDVQGDVDDKELKRNLEPRLRQLGTVR